MLFEAEGLYGWVLVVVLSVLPGFCEELFFRGYVQTRLVAAWGGAGLILPAFLFALAHFDLQHSPLVLPLGLWCGFVAWRTGSVWTAILVHAFNNLSAFLIARATTEGSDMTTGVGPVYTGAAAALLVATVLAVRGLLRSSRTA